MFLFGESGVERYVQVSVSFDDTQQQLLTSADTRGAGEVLGASFAEVHAPATACTGHSRVVTFDGTSSTGGRLGDHTGQRVSVRFQQGFSVALRRQSASSQRLRLYYEVVANWRYCKVFSACCTGGGLTIWFLRN